MLSGPAPDREAFPRVVEAIGEDPARFLDRDTSADGLAPIILGMDDIGRVRAWKDDGDDPSTLRNALVEVDVDGQETTASVAA